MASTSITQDTPFYMSESSGKGIDMLGIIEIALFIIIFGGFAFIITASLWNDIKERLDLGDPGDTFDLATTDGLKSYIERHRYPGT